MTLRYASVGYCRWRVGKTAEGIFKVAGPPLMLGFSNQERVLQQAQDERNSRNPITL
jgi:hypothetical protein